MIAEIFLPEKLGKTRLIPQRILGIAIQEDEVKLACIYANGTKTIIESFAQQIIEPGIEATYQTRAAEAVKKIIAPYKHYHQIRVAIPASIVTFKELQVPFVDQEKIRMILDYEIEAMLPFSISEAIVDFIITKAANDQQPSQLLVAAVRAQDLQAILDIYSQAGVEPTNITIDLCAIYGLYQQIHDYETIPHASALVDVGAMTTRIGFLQDGALRIMRSIPRGMTTIIKGISEELGISPEEAGEKLSRHGITMQQDDAYNRVTQKHFINFFNDIQFTLNSFSIKLSFYEGIGKILFVGKVIHINGLVEFSSNTLQIPCEAFDCKKLLEHATIKDGIKNNATDWSFYAVALGTALPSPQQSAFDLRRKSFILTQNPTIMKQLLTITLLFSLLIATVCINSFLQINRLQNDVDKANMDAIAQLKTIVPKSKNARQLQLAPLLTEAKTALTKKAALWDSFSPENRMEPLQILFELTTIFEQHLQEVTMEEVTMTIDTSGEQSVTVNGFYKSKKDSNFTNFDKEISPKFKNSTFFTLLRDQIETTEAKEGKGIHFPIKLKVKK